MDIHDSPLLTDLYQLTMVDSYLQRGMVGPASFELFSRKLPPGRSFYIAAGIEETAAWLENLAFGEDELEWVRSCGHFRPDFADELATMRFTGHFDAVPEGTVLFPNEPILRVTAPLPVAQLVESRLMNLVHIHTLLTSKAARCVLAAGGRRLVDFGMRRAHGAEAALAAARATWIAGFDGTATCLAGALYGIPTVGTMAHSYILAFEREIDAFRAFADAHPDNVILLIDTYDTMAAAHKVVQLTREGIPVKGVRLDSGDLADEARKVRSIFDEGGQQQIQILASGNLDEHEITRLIAAGAPIDGFGTGTLVDTAADQPHLDMAYKLQEYNGQPRRKRSTGKMHWPARKQIFRVFNEETCAGDTVGLADETLSGSPLLERVLENGKRLGPATGIQQIRERIRDNLRQLPPACLRLDASPEAYPVTISSALEEAARKADSYQV